ncbi:MAG: hypothetical protein VW268_04435 [Rhodospirillaceae bacterium]
MANVIDPFGQVWTLMTHTGDLTPEEIQKGFEDMMAPGELCPAADGGKADNG